MQLDRWFGRLRIRFSGVRCAGARPTSLRARFRAALLLAVAALMVTVSTGVLNTHPSQSFSLASQADASTPAFRTPATLAAQRLPAEPRPAARHAKPVVRAAAGAHVAETSRPAPAVHPAPPAVPRPKPAPARPRPANAAASPATTSAGYGCGAALAYLAKHAAPGFSFECPGYALGHQAMTCTNVPGVCPGSKIIVINDPCSAAYMNEAYNSWIITKSPDGPFDPYGYCH